MSVILVTGGAGYIGSHACKALARAGHTPIVVDCFSTGWRDACQFGPVEEANLTDKTALDRIFERYAPDAVMHFAALSDVAQASLMPDLYWQNNVTGSFILLEAMRAAGCRHIVFSSTCAIYGDQDGIMLSEGCDKRPLNAYGASKLAVEHMLGNYSLAYDIRSVALRYFNVAGADAEGQIGEHHRPETHLIPSALDAVSGRRERLMLYGQDYDTADGTCIRDYLHVSDLVDAHLLGLEYLLEGGSSDVFNLGTGTGFSVRQVIDAVQSVTGEILSVDHGPRRPGDAARLVSGSNKAAEVLGWSPERSTLEQMIETAWAWHQRGNVYRT